MCNICICRCTFKQVCIHIYIYIYVDRYVRLCFMRGMLDCRIWEGFEGPFTFPAPTEGTDRDGVLYVGFIYFWVLTCIPSASRG